MAQPSAQEAARSLMPEVARPSAQEAARQMAPEVSRTTRAVAFGAAEGDVGLGSGTAVDTSSVTTVEQRRREHGNRKRRRCHDGGRYVHDGATARQNPPSPSSLRIDREESLAHHTTREPRNMKGRREEQRRRAHGNRNRRRCHDGSRCAHDGITARQNPPSPSSLRLPSNRSRRTIGTSHADR